MGPIDLDPCSNPTSIVQARIRYELPYHNGLLEPWRTRDIKTVFVNPPFGRGIEVWLKRCYLASVLGAEVVALVPANVETKIWQEVVFPTAKGICFPKARVKFLVPERDQIPEYKPTPFVKPVSFLYWGRRYSVEHFYRSFSHLGACLEVYRGG